MKALIIGGNKFFGLRLAKLLVEEGHNVTLLNRGNLDDGLGDKVDRIRCDRNDYEQMKVSLEDHEWDVVFDQVCFDYERAQQACEIFKNKTQKIVFTSSMSVYGEGEEHIETNFNPYTYQFTNKVYREENYAEGKRQAEVAYFKYAPCPVVAVRFPIVFGNDDATKRFDFHVEHIANNEPIFFPNLNAKLTLIRSDLAAEMLVRLSIISFEGPINVACGEPLSLMEYMEIIEKNVGNKMILSEIEKEDATSPWGIPSSWTMSLDKARSLNLPAPPIRKMLDDGSLFNVVELNILDK